MKVARHSAPPFGVAARSGGAGPFALASFALAAAACSDPPDAGPDGGSDARADDAPGCARPSLDEAWLPAMATYTASARVALVKVMRRGGVMEFSDYKKFTVDTSTTPARPKVP